jgi:hypothetical protein
MKPAAAFSGWSQTDDRSPDADLGGRLTGIVARVTIFRIAIDLWILPRPAVSGSAVAAIHQLFLSTAFEGAANFRGG